MKNALMHRLRSGNDPSFGTWISSASGVALDALRGAGFDWLMIDTEHSHVNPESLASMVALCGDTGPTPLVRVGDVNQYLIKQALDAGAHGVLVPLVSTAAQARSVVAYAKYPPAGVRGAAASAASHYGRDLANYLRSANAETFVGVQIETREALEHVDDIAAVDGIDLLFVGPTDLTLSLGLVDDRTNPKVREAMRRVVDVCRRHDRVPGTLVLDAVEARAALEIGFRFISLASDVRFLLNGAKAFRESVLGSGATPAPGPGS
jgi:2-keto-3-deoxy-L-rhamnonate aldolase RhmA